MFIIFIYAFINNHCINPHKVKDLNQADILSDNCKYFLFSHLLGQVSYKSPHAISSFNTEGWKIFICLTRNMICRGDLDTGLS